MDVQIIECKFKESDWAINVPLQYTCSVRNQQIFDSTEMQLIGRHMDEKTNEDVTGVFFYSCPMTRIPQGLTKIFPNLKFLSVGNSNLRYVDRDDLKEYSNLLYLSLRCNQIEFLPGDLFTDMTFLERISFQDNKIQVIESNLLDGFQSINYLNLLRNPCINEKYDKDQRQVNTILQEAKEAIRKFTATYVNEYLKSANKELRNKLADYNDVCVDLKEIINNEKFKDFTIIVDNEEFKVHKFLLAARSPVLKQMIETNANAECLNLVDISSDIFREIVNFIYTDLLPFNPDIDMARLFAAAGRLKIDKLKNFAAKKLIKTIDDETDDKCIMELLILANKYNSDELREWSWKIMKTYLYEDIFEDSENEIDDNLAMQPEKVQKLYELKKKKEEVLEQMHSEFQKVLKEK